MAPALEQAGLVSVFVVADQKLRRAAMIEGFTTLNPEQPICPDLLTFQRPTVGMGVFLSTGSKLPLISATEEASVSGEPRGPSNTM